jgi:hypothetical protein
MVVGCSGKKDQIAGSPATPGVKSYSAKAEIPTKTPEDWLVVEDTTFLPVFDDVSRKMLGAQRAFLKKDNKGTADDGPAECLRSIRRVVGRFCRRGEADAEEYRMPFR